MISDATTIELFTTWTTDFDVQVDLARKRLTFTPAPSPEGLYHRPRSLLARPGKGERGYQKHIAAMLSLNASTPARVWQQTAEDLGPLFAEHPLHHSVINDRVVESIDDWLTARDHLADVWNDLHALATASTAPRSEEDERELAMEKLALAGLGVPPYSLPESQLDALLKAYLPTSTETDASMLLTTIGTGLNRWFQEPHPRIVPLLNAATYQVEIVVPQGIQALLLMTVALARADMTAFPSRCARPGCTAITFMKGRRRYCSTGCQTAHKSARYRQRALQKK